MWRTVRDYEGVCKLDASTAPWRQDLLECPANDERCERVSSAGSTLEVFALRGTAAEEGVFLCPNVLAGDQQRSLLRALLCHWAAPPNCSNLWPPPAAERVAAEDAAAELRRGLEEFTSGASGDANGHPSTDGAGCCPLGLDVVERLRWVTVGRQYDWATRTYREEDGDSHELPEELRELAEAVVAALPLQVQSQARPFEAAICNFYHAARRPSDRLGGHRDDVEEDTTSPLVGVSIGLPCIFLLGGESRATAPTPILLQGGSAIVLSGRARQAFHGVPTVLVPPPLQLRGRAPRPQRRFRGAHAGVYFPWGANDAEGDGEADAHGTVGADPELSLALEWLMRRARVSFSIRSVGEGQ